MIISIEGTDGSGKHTQAELLYNFIKEKFGNCELISFPNYESPACAPVKMYLNGDFGDSSSLDAYQANALYAVDRLCTMQQYKSFIENGGNIVFDRYTQSTMLHQSALLKDQNEIDSFLQYVEHFEFGILKLPKPDVVVFLDVPVEYGKKLADARKQYKSGMKNDIYEQDFAHLKKAYNAGKYVANKMGWLTIECVKNGKMLSIDEIHKDILTKLGL